MGRGRGWFLFLGVLFCTQVNALENSQTNRRGSEKTEPLIYQYRAHNDHWQVSAFGEVLLWKTHETVSDFVTTGLNPPFAAGQGEQGLYGTLQFADFDRDVGFRVGLSGDFDPRYWGILVDYTDFKNSTDQRFTTDQANRLNGTYYEWTGESPHLAVSHISFDYQVLNVLLRQQLLASETLLFDLYAGATLNWIDQDWRFSYTRFRKTEFFRNWHYQGAGARIGARADWYLLYGFSIATNLSGAGFYGDLHAYGKDLEFLDTGVNYPFADFNYDEKRVVFQGQMSIGPTWGWKWDNGCALKVYGVYELNALFGLLENYKYEAQTAPNAGKESEPFTGMIGIEGWNLGLEFTF